MTQSTYRGRPENKEPKSNAELRALINGIRAHYKKTFGEDVTWEMLYTHIRCEIMIHQQDFLQRSLGRVLPSAELVDLVPVVTQMEKEEKEAAEKSVVVSSPASSIVGINSGRKAKDKKKEPVGPS